MEQHTITFKASADTHARLQTLADQIDRPKSYLLRQAIEEFLEEKEDYLIALKRLADDKPEKRIPLEELEKRYGMTDE